jgi:putative transposase
MCRALGVSRSGFYAWRAQPRSPRSLQSQELTRLIRAIHVRSRGTYGSPRIHAELRLGHGIRCGRKRVARIMRAHNLVGCGRRRRWATTRRDDGARRAPDLVARRFGAPAPDRLWVADITFVPTARGFVYLAVVIDAFSRAVVGWSMRRHQLTELVTSALDMAITHRVPRPGLIHHSDQGSQYTSTALRRQSAQAGIALSMGRRSDAYDNALVESFFATLECECIDRHRFATKEDAELEVFRFIEGFYNRRRRHSSLDYLSPADYERRHREHQSMNQLAGVH